MYSPLQSVFYSYCQARVSKRRAQIRRRWHGKIHDRLLSNCDRRIDRLNETIRLDDAMLERKEKPYAFEKIQVSHDQRGCVTHLHVDRLIGTVSETADQHIGHLAIKSSSRYIHDSRNYPRVTAHWPPSLFQPTFFREDRTTLDETVMLRGYSEIMCPINLGDPVLCEYSRAAMEKILKLVSHLSFKPTECGACSQCGTWTDKNVVKLSSEETFPDLMDPPLFTNRIPSQGKWLPRVAEANWLKPSLDPIGPKPFIEYCHYEVASSSINLELVHELKLQLKSAWQKCEGMSTSHMEKPPRKRSRTDAMLTPITLGVCPILYKCRACAYLDEVERSVLSQLLSDSSRCVAHTLLPPVSTLNEELFSISSTLANPTAIPLVVPACKNSEGTHLNRRLFSWSIHLNDLRRESRNLAPLAVTGLNNYKQPLQLVTELIKACECRNLQRTERKTCKPFSKQTSDGGDKETKRDGTKNKRRQEKANGTQFKKRSCCGQKRNPKVHHDRELSAFKSPAKRMKLEKGRPAHPSSIVDENLIANIDHRCEIDSFFEFSDMISGRKRAKYEDSEIVKQKRYLRKVKQVTVPSSVSRKSLEAYNSSDFGMQAYRIQIGLGDLKLAENPERSSRSQESQPCVQIICDYTQTDSPLIWRALEKESIFRCRFIERCLQRPLFAIINPDTCVLVVSDECILDADGTASNTSTDRNLCDSIVIAMSGFDKIWIVLDCQAVAEQGKANQGQNTEMIAFQLRTLQKWLHQIKAVSSACINLRYLCKCALGSMVLILKEAISGSLSDESASRTKRHVQSSEKCEDNNNSLRALRETESDKERFLSTIPGVDCYTAQLLLNECTLVDILSWPRTDLESLKISYPQFSHRVITAVRQALK